LTQPDEGTLNDLEVRAQPGTARAAVGMREIAAIAVEVAIVNNLSFMFIVVVGSR
jgi:hypothetical protein